MQEQGRAEGKGDRDAAEQHPAQSPHAEPAAFAHHPDGDGRCPDRQIAGQGTGRRVGIRLANEQTQIKGRPFRSNEVQIGEPGEYPARHGQGQIEPGDPAEAAGTLLREACGFAHGV